MKHLFLFIILLGTSIISSAQEEKLNTFKFYANAGSTAAYKYKVGAQGGISVGKKNHLIKFQYMYKLEIYLGDASHGKPNEVESLKTYSLSYGHSYDFKKISLIPTIGIIKGEENYRGEITASSRCWWLCSGTYYEYKYSLSNFYGARVGIELIVKYSTYIGFSFEPYINIYNTNRPDIGISFNMVFGKIN